MFTIRGVAYTKDRRTRALELITVAEGEVITKNDFDIVIDTLGYSIMHFKRAINGLHINLSKKKRWGVYYYGDCTISSGSRTMYCKLDGEYVFGILPFKTTTDMSNIGEKRKQAKYIKR